MDGFDACHVVGLVCALAVCGVIGGGSVFIERDGNNLTVVRLFVRNRLSDNVCTVWGSQLANHYLDPLHNWVCANHVSCR